MHGHPLEWIGVGLCMDAWVASEYCIQQWDKGVRWYRAVR